MARKIKTWKISITGRVQGVGFRPYVSQLANQLNLKGEVFNDNYGLGAIFNADDNQKKLFTENIMANPPIRARINEMSIQEIPTKHYDGFKISESQSEERVDLLIAPDYAICENCLKDLQHLGNRRYQYAFTSCVACGPRYSVINSLPYDRANTSYHHHGICDGCQEEYCDTSQRRFHAQTLTCSQCSITIRFKSENESVVEDLSEVYNRSIDLLEKGQILSVKSTSGYLLCCHAENSEAVLAIRKVKGRYHKPLAVMYPFFKEVSARFWLSQKESELIRSERAPIVLLRPKTMDELPRAINHGLDRVGVFLPNNGLMHTLLSQFGKPLVVTSANASGTPIAFNQESENEIMARSQGLIDHDLAIVMPQDDSVVQVTKDHHQFIMIRRSKGWSPEYLGEDPKLMVNLLATGADLKNTICLYSNGNIYLSQNTGDQQNLASQNRTAYLASKWMELLGKKPQVIIKDRNAYYFSHQWAEKLIDQYQAATCEVYHHHAHLSAIMGEYNLWDKEGLIGFVWDGVGLGEDQHIWGGECFQWSERNMERLYHLEYVPWISGNKMSKEPRLSAAVHFRNIQSATPYLEKGSEGLNSGVIDHQIDKAKLMTSSMGRWFDAIASILGICHINQFEGQAAMLLESIATQAKHKQALLPYNVNLLTKEIALYAINLEIIEDLQRGLPAANIAYKFHLTLVEIIKKIAERSAKGHMAFSGGVFQNALLVDLIITHLGEKYSLYFHEKMSPNDENISFGQMMYFAYCQNN